MVGKISTDSMPAPTRAAAFSGSIRPSAVPIAAMTTMSGKPVAEKRRERHTLRLYELSTIQEQGGSAPDHQHEGEEEREAQEGTGSRDEDVHVEVNATHDEEDGDEKAEPDGGQLALDRLAVRPYGQQPNDDAGGEGPQQHVQPELECQVDEDEHEEDRHTDRQLRAGVEVTSEQGNDPRRMGACGKQCSGRGDHHEGDQQNAAYDRILVSEENCNDHDGSELTDRTDPENVGTERRL